MIRSGTGMLHRRNPEHPKRTFCGKPIGKSWTETETMVRGQDDVCLKCDHRRWADKADAMKADPLHGQIGRSLGGDRASRGNRWFSARSITSRARPG